MLLISYTRYHKNYDNKNQRGTKLGDRETEYIKIPKTKGAGTLINLHKVVETKCCNLL